MLTTGPAAGDSTDLAMMHRALRLAERGRGRTAPNPIVGAVIARDGIVIADGFHERAGQAHAEVRALDAAGDRARDATLYCTLEPCCHTGRTGPCVERIAAAGIRRVVAATVDPNPLVAGGGIAWLRARGIDVTVGVGEQDAARQNAPFFTRVRRERPYVIAKAGVSLDGRIAEGTGLRTEITGPVSRRAVQRTRAEVDAIGVGSGTVLVDDPLLTVRDVYRGRPLTRVIFDRRLRTRATARIVGTRADGPIIVFTTSAAVRNRPADIAALEAVGVQVQAFDDEGLGAQMKRLAEMGVSSLLLEGGAVLHASAWDAGIIDRVQLYIAPRTLGSAGVPLFNGRPFSVTDLRHRRVEPCGDDVLIEGDVHRVD